jgi:alkyldihydroxyacetonephosphate synthase
MDLRPLTDTGVAWSRAPLDLDAARRDLWPRGTLALRGGRRPPRPEVVAWPRDRHEVAKLLTAAAAMDLAVVPYGAGSGVCGGAAGRAGAMVIDTKRMNKVLHLDEVRGLVHVQPGLLGQHLEDWLERRGLMTAHSPSSIMCSTVGGWVAARSAGQFSSRYGVFDDMVVAAAAETPAGRLLTGAWTPEGEEDLLPVLAGSEGALGVITDVVCRVVPIPGHRWLRGYALPSMEAAWAAMRALMQADNWPSVLRLYDPVDSRIGGPARKAARELERHGRGTPRFVERLREAVAAVPALHQHLLEVPLALPRLINRIADGLGDEVLLIVGFEGPEAVVDAAVAEALPLLAAGRDLGPSPGEYWYAHRHDVSYKLAPIFAGGGWADTMEVAAPWSRLEALHTGVRRAIGERALVMAHFSHAYPEGCSIYFSFAGGGDVETYDAVWRDGLAAAREAGGTVTHHHGVGQLKAEAAAREAGAGLRVWRQIKARWDPDGRMNPGRPFPEDAPEAPGPARPQDPGPVYRVDEESRLAAVDPHAAPEAVQDALARRGYALRVVPDRPLADWIPALRRGALDRWNVPFFGVQARFDDGASARLGPAPRSAAGPDLRQALLRRATAEWVEVPVVPLAAGGRPPWHVRRAPTTGPTAEQARPTWRDTEHWGFLSPRAAAALDGAIDADAPAIAPGPGLHLPLPEDAA